MNGNLDHREHHGEVPPHPPGYEDLAGHGEPRVKPVVRTTSSTPEKYITLRIRPRNLERLIFVAIILFLGVMLVFKPFGLGTTLTKEKTLPKTIGLSVQEQSTNQTSLPSTETKVTAATTTTTNAQTNTSANVGKNVTTTSTAKSNATNASLKPAPVNQTKPAAESNALSEAEGPIDPSLVDFKIGSVGIVKKTDNWAKVTSINITIINRGYKLRPLIKVYAWDEATEDMLSDHQEGADWRYDPGIGMGTTKTLSIDTSISFSDFDLQKTIKLKLFDSRTNKLVKEAVKNFNID
jgi:hypothetical protein